MDIDRSIADPEGYRSFLTVPVSRKGYSGVGVFVRKSNQKDSDYVKRALTVVKVEEGITGTLTLKPAKRSYRESYELPEFQNLCIGGYPELSDPDTCKKIDSEGRCVIVELNFDLVVISVYCPANSMRTEEGEAFRITFLKCLLERADNLAKMGKHVVIMGDINVSLDLIDNDETIKTGLHEKILTWDEDSAKFEEINKKYVLEFKKSTEPRSLLNDYTYDTTGMISKEDKLLHDVVREFTGRRLKMYTVWNTLLNSRSLNIGSRIDLILATDKLAACVKAADIWPSIFGSDHCPIFTDFDIQKIADDSKTDSYEQFKSKNNHFDASRFYNLHIGKSIDFFFSSKKKSVPIKQQQSPEKQSQSSSSTVSSSQENSQQSSTKRKASKIV
ncbi:unnamed protein product [Ambrosiozyma monospora]|uniref:Unnamed protein product n=1 Tax=Ambrosiozyma monospora TaxID=43982 RepID=A0ACB5T5C8_AMBMO|nr:unnamed protein product [Ambrosiozyma monospora]